MALEDEKFDFSKAEYAYFAKQLNSYRGTNCFVSCLCGRCHPSPFGEVTYSETIRNMRNTDDLVDFLADMSLKGYRVRDIHDSITDRWPLTTVYVQLEKCDVTDTNITPELLELFCGLTIPDFGLPSTS